MALPQDHNHQHCIDTALSCAQQVCKEHNARLTTLRQQVLLLIWQNHRPLGAYDLMAMLAQETGRQIAPPTVYRALDFLLSLGLIHRIHSLNAYIGCPNPSHQHQSYFFICAKCHHTVESNDQRLATTIADVGVATGFSMTQAFLEVLGLCSQCQQDCSSEGLQ